MIELMREKERKYMDLVWYARKPPLDDPWWDTLLPEIKRGAMKGVLIVEGEYPKETSDLARPEDGGWHHGFNSGMLAGMRFALSAMEDPEEAEHNFPELHT